MQVERIISGVTTLGPGQRMVVWVNGCNRRCEGCVSPRLQQFEPRNETDIVELLKCLDLTCVDGVTFSGGEPFEQTAELCRAVEYLNSEGIEDILVYSGYTIEQLSARQDYFTNKVLQSISVLIDGPYVKERDSGTDNLRGSDNQRILVLKSRYQKLYDEYHKNKRVMQEFRIGNRIVAAGIPDKKYIESFLSQNIKEDRT